MTELKQEEIVNVDGGNMGMLIGIAGVASGHWVGNDLVNCFKKVMKK